MIIIDINKIDSTVMTPFNYILVSILLSILI